MNFFYYYLVIVNALGLFIMPIDKENAKRGWRRVSELTLLSIAFLGGSIGMYLGIFIFRHKTKKPLFTVGIFFMILFHVGALFLLNNGVLP